MPIYLCETHKRHARTGVCAECVRVELNAVKDARDRLQKECHRLSDILNRTPFARLSDLLSIGPVRLERFTEESTCSQINAVTVSPTVGPPITSRVFVSDHALAMRGAERLPLDALSSAVAKLHEEQYRIMLEVETKREKQRG